MGQVSEGLIHISTVLHDLELIDKRALAKKRRTELTPLIDEICHEYGLSSQQLHIRAGVAHKVIPSVANKIKADLVVLGTVGRRGVAAQLIGNTAEKVLTHLRTDVLALKPQG